VRNVPAGSPRGSNCARRRPHGVTRITAGAAGSEISPAP
jgi:hypothetical protein